jgi:hypothetical protein
MSGSSKHRLMLCNFKSGSVDAMPAMWNRGPRKESSKAAGGAGNPKAKILNR